MAITVMFLCTQNACRSQMAEALMRELSQGKVEAYSSGVETSEINPKAIQVMSEVGIDISHQYAKGIDVKKVVQMDHVITLCDDAERRCPITPYWVKRHQWPFDDPATATGGEEDVLNHFRQVRDAIKDKVMQFLNQLG